MAGTLRPSRLGEALLLAEGGEVLRPRDSGRFRADARQEPYHALEGDFIPRIDGKLHEGRDILHMGLLEKPGPLVMENGMPRRVSSSCTSIEW